MKKKFFWSFIINSGKETFINKTSEKIKAMLCILNDNINIKIEKYWKIENTHKITIIQETEFENPNVFFDYLFKTTSLFSLTWMINICLDNNFSMVCNDGIKVIGMTWISLQISD